jgi:hypothetical protein
MVMVMMKMVGAKMMVIIVMLLYICILMPVKLS